MNALTATFRVHGGNRELLFQKLKKNGITVLNEKKSGEKSFEITIDNKDCDKFFAICKKTWYNEKIKVGGVLAPFYKIIHAPQIAIACVLFVAVTLFSGNLFLGAEYRKDALLYRQAVENAFEQCGIRFGASFSEEKIEKAERYLSERFDFAFLQIEKRANRAIVEIKDGARAPERMISTLTDVIASEDLTILKMSVYSGTPLVKEGDLVKKGAPIIGAYQTIKETPVPCPITGSVSAKCAFDFAYTCKTEPTDGDVSRAVSAAHFMLGDYTVCGSEVSVEDKTIKVKLYYEKIIFGG